MGVCRGGALCVYLCWEVGENWQSIKLPLPMEPFDAKRSGFRSLHADLHRYLHGRSFRSLKRLDPLRLGFDPLAHKLQT